MLEMCPRPFPAPGTDKSRGADAAVRGKGYTDLSVPQARQLLMEDRRATLVDTRSPAEYRKGTLPGSISIPEAELDRLAPALLPDRTAPVLVFCRTGAYSWRSAQRLAELGYTRVYNAGGYLEWRLGR